MNEKEEIIKDFVQDLEALKLKVDKALIELKYHKKNASTRRVQQLLVQALRAFPEYTNLIKRVFKQNTLLQPQQIKQLEEKESAKEEKGKNLERNALVATSKTKAKPKPKINLDKK